MEKQIKDCIPIMSSFPELKKLAERHGLKAEYVPVVGAVEIMCEDIAVGITYDGVRVKDNFTKKYHNIKQWTKIVGRTKTFLESFNGAFNEKNVSLKT